MATYVIIKPLAPVRGMGQKSFYPDDQQSPPEFCLYASKILENLGIWDDDLCLKK